MSFPEFFAREFFARGSLFVKRLPLALPREKLEPKKNQRQSETMRYRFRTELVIFFGGGEGGSFIADTAQTLDKRGMFRV